MIDYELLDSGDQQKLERLGEAIIIRPEPLAVWSKKLPLDVWQENIAAEYRAPRAQIGVGEWIFSDPKIETNPPILSWSPGKLRFQVKFMPSRHLGIFLEHESQWQFIINQISDVVASTNSDFHFLNLFGFTGAASLAAAAAGAQVTHIDSSYEAIGLGRVNQELSGLQNAPIRWIKEDVSKFIDRELRRHPCFYDGIILDPPAHGHGARRGETWHLATMLPDLISKLSQLLSPRAQFLILNTYTEAHFSPEIFQSLANHFPYHQSGNLSLPQTSRPNQPLILSRFELFTKKPVKI